MHHVSQKFLFLVKSFNCINGTSIISKAKIIYSVPFVLLHDEFFHDLFTHSLLNSTIF
ncbi:hypothetical protein Scep_017725 [Stephania cephalantha]|uniref:Uncharacterized protein n=1 Tax=Stephania cephalantha TaxID=152367 RepID=A0AAP0NTV0_9MAGN